MLCIFCVRERGGREKASTHNHPSVQIYSGTETHLQPTAVNNFPIAVHTHVSETPYQHANNEPEKACTFWGCEELNAGIITAIQP